ncbi:ALP1-like protein isoform X1 [Tanacetum coccineum]
MSRELFTNIVEEATNHCAYVRNNINYTGREDISALLKCTSAIRQLEYDIVPNAIDEYWNIGATTSRESLDYFCKSVMEIFGAEYLRKPTYTHVEKIYEENNDINVIHQSPIFNDLKDGKTLEVSFVANGVTYNISEMGDEHLDAFGGNTRDLGSFGEETDKITDLHQIHKEVLFTERGDGVAGIKRRRRDLSSDGVRDLATTSGRGRLKEDLESST